MLIVSQDREMAVNLNQVKEITIIFTNEDTKNQFALCACFSEEDFEELGQYQTKNKAMEVIDNLTIAYGLERKVFKMPK